MKRGDKMRCHRCSAVRPVVDVVKKKGYEETYLGCGHVLVAHKKGFKPTEPVDLGVELADYTDAERAPKPRPELKYWR